MQDSGQITVGSVLGESWRIFRSNFLLFIGIAFLPGLAELADSVGSKLTHLRPDSPYWLWDHRGLLSAVSFLVFLISVVLAAMATGAFSFATAKLQVSEEVSAGSAFRFSLTAMQSLVGIALYQCLFAFWPMFAGLVLSIALIGLANTARADFIVLPAVILCAIPCLILYARFAMAPSICMIEGASAYASIQRSRELGSGHGQTIFRSLFIPAGACFVLSWTCDWAISRNPASIEWMGHSWLMLPLLSHVPDFVFGLMFAPFCHIAFTVFYQRLLRQKEGLTLDDVRRGVLDARRISSYPAEEDGPWDEAPETVQAVPSDSVGIPWSMFGSREAIAAMHDDLETIDEERRENANGGEAPQAGNPI